MLTRRHAGLHHNGTSGVVLSGDRLTGTYVHGGSTVFGGTWIRRAAGWTGKRYFEFTPLGSLARGYHFGFMKHTEWLGAGSYPENPYAIAFYGVCNGNTLGMTIGRILNGTAVGSASYDFAVNDVLGFAVDYDVGDAWILKNDVAITGDPEAGTGAPFAMGAGGNWDPYCTAYAASATSGFRIAATGAHCVYSPPAGFGHLDS